MSEGVRRTAGTPATTTATTRSSTRWVRASSASADPEPGDRILDLGCGTGHLTAEIAAAVGDEGDVVGVDQSAEMITEAREQYPGLAFERADVTEYDPGESFDAVFSNAALHWMTDQDAVVGRVADALRPRSRETNAASLQEVGSSRRWAATATSRPSSTLLSRNWPAGDTRRAVPGTFRQ